MLSNYASDLVCQNRKDYDINNKQIGAEFPNAKIIQNVP